MKWKTCRCNIFIFTIISLVSKIYNIVTTVIDHKMYYKIAGGLIYFNSYLPLVLIQNLPLFEYWFNTITNILLIIYSQPSFTTGPYSSIGSLSRLALIQVLTLFQDWPLFKYCLSFEPLRYIIYKRYLTIHVTFIILAYVLLT